MDMEPSSEEEDVDEEIGTSEARKIHYGEWKEVPGFEGALLASETGYIWQREHRYGHWLRPRTGVTNGYGYKKIKYFKKSYNVHVLICTAFHGKRPSSKHSVDHSNRNKTDNRASNLRWATPSEQQVNTSKSVLRRDARPIWVWKSADGESTAVRFESAIAAAEQCETKVNPSNLRKVARGEYKQTAGYQARFEERDEDALIAEEEFRPSGKIFISQFGRMKTFHGTIITPKPLEGQIYATYNNQLFHRLVAKTFPDIVGVQPDDPSFTVDHKNRKCTDNRASNLRWASKQLQRENQSN